MRTTLEIDDEALAGALRQAPGATKTAVVNQALREFARRRKQKEFLSLRGQHPWQGDLDQLRRRRTAR